MTNRNPKEEKWREVINSIFEEKPISNQPQSSSSLTPSQHHLSGAGAVQPTSSNPEKECLLELALQWDEHEDLRVTKYSKVAAWDWPVRDYQKKGILHLNRKKRAMNHDDPGLGKTAQAAFAAESPTLIICPNYLVSQWFDWLRGADENSKSLHEYDRDTGEKLSWNDKRRIVKNVKGTIRRCRGNFSDKETVLRKQRTNPAEWVIINMEMLRTHFEELMDLSFRTIIIDEAHHFKTHTAERSRNLVELCTTAPFVFELTATPIWKEVDDLYNQFKLLQPDMFESYNKFVDLFCIADKGRYGTNVLGLKKEMIKELDALLNLVAIRRTYETAGRFLPQTLDKFVKVDFPPNLRKTYDDLVDDFRAQLEGETIEIDNFSQMINTLRQLTGFPGKFDAVKNIIEDTKGKIVVFTWYRDTAYIAANTYGGVAITGDIKDPAERRRIALNPNNRIICATISALAEGVDLSSARTVIFLEEHWPPGANKQALSRVRRDRNDNGANKEPVVVYYVHVSKTIDEHIHRVSQRRSATAKELIREAVGLE